MFLLSITAKQEGKVRARANFLKIEPALAGILAIVAPMTGAYAVDNWSIPITNTEGDGKQIEGTWRPLDTSKIKKTWNICVLFPAFEGLIPAGRQLGVVSEARRDHATMQLYQAGGYGNLSTQLNQMDNCIAQRVDGMILGAISADGVGSLVR